MRLQWKREWTAPSAIGAVSYILGAGTMVGIGILIDLKRKKTEVKNNDTDEVKGAIESFQVLITQNDFRIQEQWESFNQSISAMARIINDLTDISNGDKPKTFDDRVDDLYVPEELPLNKTVDVTAVNSEWDEEVEVKNRNPSEPYIIHRNEYYNDEEGFGSHATLTYYKGDDVLCDEHDTPIYNVHKIVGELKFGHGSNDPSIVYIRNEILKAEYEVLLDPGYFQVEVLGEEMAENLSDDLKHSHIRKFRSD